MITLFGRGETKKTNPYDQLNLLTLTNVATGTMKFSPKLISVLDLGDKYISIATDVVMTEGANVPKETKIFYLFLSDEKNGFKVAKNGSCNSKYYTRELGNYLATGRLENVVLEVSVEATIMPEYPEIKFYRIDKSFKDSLEDTTAIIADAVIEPEMNGIISEKMEDILDAITKDAEAGAIEVKEENAVSIQ